MVSKKQQLFFTLLTTNLLLAIPLWLQPKIAQAEAEEPPNLKDDVGRLIGIGDSSNGTILDLLTRIAYVLAIAAIIYAGILYFTAFGNEERPAKAKQVIVVTIIGLAIIIFARVIVYSVEGLVTQEKKTTAPKVEEKTSLKIESKTQLVWQREIEDILAIKTN